MTTQPVGVPTHLSGVAAGGGVGASPLRPDGVLKVRGEFAYASDLWTEGMLWGCTLRSPHPFARLRSIDVSAALAVAGVRAVLTAEDVPGTNRYGLELADQPVLADDTVRYQGEPVALVAADHPEIARQAAKRIRVNYDVWEPVTDAQAALGHPTWNMLHDSSAPATGISREAAHLHPKGNLVRHLRLRTGDENPTAPVVVVGEYEVGMQDQAFLGPSPGSPCPPRTAASTCTSPPSGCTPTSGRSARRWRCRRRRSG